MTTLPTKPTKKQIIIRLVAIFVLSMVFAIGKMYFKDEEIHWDIMLFIGVGIALLFTIIGIYASKKSAIRDIQALKKTVKKQSLFFLVLGGIGLVLLFLQLLVVPGDFSFERLVTPTIMIVLSGIGFVRYKKMK